MNVMGQRIPEELTKPIRQAKARSAAHDHHRTACRRDIVITSLQERTRTQSG
jgi:hypothetical protein